MAGLTNLTTLNLFRTQVTDSGRKQLRLALPKCRVSEQNVRWTEYPTKTCFECRVALLQEDDGGYSVYAISVPGVASQGETEKEAIANIVDALSGALAEYKIVRR